MTFKDSIITEIKTLTLKDKNTDAIVLTFDTTKYNIATCRSIYEKIAKEFPEDKVVNSPFSETLTILESELDHVILLFMLVGIIRAFKVTFSPI